MKMWAILIMMVSLTGCGPFGVSSTSDESKGSFEFEQKVLARTASLADWGHASAREKRYFANKYTQLHLGGPDSAKAQDIIIFLDTSAKKLSGALQKKNTPQESIDQVLAKSKLFTLSAAGARLMGWTDPVGDISAAEN